MYMYRKVSEYLKQWKDSKYRKPLIIQGARQVGKTYAILEFGRRYYDNVASGMMPCPQNGFPSQ